MRFPLASFLFFAAAPSRALAQPCRPSWSPPFAGGDLFGGGVRAFTRFDEDGAGPSPQVLVAGRYFITAGGIGAGGVVKWDGTERSPPRRREGATIHALAVFDENGAGPSPPALFAGGEFTNAGAAAASRNARWDGASRSPLGSGIGIPFTTAAVGALGVFDLDGPEPSPVALFAGGNFETAGAVSSPHVAAWVGCGSGVHSQPNLGFGEPGRSLLAVRGEPLSSGKPADLLLENATPNSFAFLATAIAANPTPLLGGALVPFPPVLVLGFPTGLAGGVSLPGIPGGGGPFDACLQFAVLDPALPPGVGFSNALKVEFPP